MNGKSFRSQWKTSLAVTAIIDLRCATQLGGKWDTCVSFEMHLSACRCRSNLP